ncbi:MAG: helix-turn-helix transcriptional regulator [Blastocatellia bacterium]
MFAVGQEVSTQYGTGTIISVGTVKPHIYVRLHSSSQIYILNKSQITDAETNHPEISTQSEVIEPAKNGHGRNGRGRVEGVASVSNHSTDRWRSQMKNTRLEEQTPLAVFVRDRLAELGMKQSEFCRLTGFDQGLLSKIQSSMITHLSLETALRLAVGLSVPPEEILVLIDRPDLHTLITKAYPNAETHLPVANGEEIPVTVHEINRLALRAYGLGRSLAPAIGLLLHLAAGRRESSNNQKQMEAVAETG